MVADTGAPVLSTHLSQNGAAAVMLRLVVMSAEVDYAGPFRSVLLAPGQCRLVLDVWLPWSLADSAVGCH